MGSQHKETIKNKVAAHVHQSKEERRNTILFYQAVNCYHLTLSCQMVAFFDFFYADEIEHPMGNGQNNEDILKYEDEAYSILYK